MELAFHRSVEQLRKHLRAGILRKNSAVRDHDDAVGNVQNAFLVGNDDNGSLLLLMNTLENLDQVSETASGSSKMESGVFLARSVAISIRLISPPERLALTSRLM